MYNTVLTETIHLYDSRILYKFQNTPFRNHALLRKIPEELSFARYWLKIKKNRLCQTEKM